MTRLLLLLTLCLPLAAQDRRFLIPVWDNDCTTLPRESCWRYAFMPNGFSLERVVDHPWAYQMLAAPGTNPGQVVRFNTDDFSVTHPSPDVQDVSVIWATPVEGGLDIGQKVWSLPGFKTKPVGCMVFRDGILLSFSRNDFTYLAPIAPSTDWNLQFVQVSEKADYIVAHCLKGP